MVYNWQQQVKPKGGFYPETKVYFDGSHYIAIPHTERPFKPRKKHIEEVVSVRDKCGRNWKNCLLKKQRIHRSKTTQIAHRKKNPMRL